MASHLQSFLFLAMANLAITLFATTIPTNAHYYTKLTPDFYNKVCPQALPTIKTIVELAINREMRMGASLLRLHFHDCFVNGCDGSILLDDTKNLIGEKNAIPNMGSVRGFEVIDEIKSAVDKACKGPVVSCADILAIAARDSVSFLGGQQYWYKVLLGRRDSRIASRDAANKNLPPPSFTFSQLLSNFKAHGLNLKDLVALSGAHTIGFAECSSFRSRIYNDTKNYIDPKFASIMKGKCPKIGGDANLAPLDYSTPNRFDTNYYKNLIGKKGLLHSDQELFKGDGVSESDKLVKLYSNNPYAFPKDFKNSMIKMGYMKPLVGNKGEIRVNCRKVN